LATLFTKIIQGKIPCHKIWEDESFFAFLDICPIAPGHTLVVPKIEVDSVFDLELNNYADLFLACRTVQQGLFAALPCTRIGMMVAGLAVPHAHVHLVPMQGEGDLNFLNAKKGNPEELANLALSIRKFF